MEQKNGELKIKTKNELTGEETEIETKTQRMKHYRKCPVKMKSTHLNLFITKTL